MTFTLLTGERQMQISAEAGMTILDALRSREGLSIHAPCGGQGTCKKCTVYLVTPQGEKPVLACRTESREGMTVRLPEESPLVGEANENAPCFPPDPGLRGYGIACDIGTTTVACHLADLSTGAVLSTLGEGNVQRAYGGDVISRIKASMDGLRPALTSAIRQQLARMMEALCHANNLKVTDITTMTVAANTTMCHLLAGLSPDSIGAAPFTPLSLFGECYDAKDLELPFEGSVYILPAVSGYVGGDITADLLAAGLDQTEKATLLIDVGTNGEMALGCGDRFICCSTAAGPAFEGAQISCGMTAAPGAISRVDWEDGEILCSVIGGGEAKGLCGSGLIDAMALMLNLGAVDETGRMLDIEEDEGEIPEEALPYLFLLDEEPAFRLTERVYVTQGDVRKLQLGKGAIAAGEKVLMNAYGAGCDEIGALLLAGGFGSYIRPESAARIGLIPGELLAVTKAVGNTAAQGALHALVSEDAKGRLHRLQRSMEYLELSGMASFNNAYMEKMMFPEEDEL